MRKQDNEEKCKLDTNSRNIILNKSIERIDTIGSNESR